MATSNAVRAVRWTWWTVAGFEPAAVIFLRCVSHGRCGDVLHPVGEPLFQRPGGAGLPSRPAVALALQGSNLLNEFLLGFGLPVSAVRCAVDEQSQSDRLLASILDGETWMVRDGGSTVATITINDYANPLLWTDHDHGTSRLLPAPRVRARPNDCEAGYPSDAMFQRPALGAISAQLREMLELDDA